MVKQIGRVEEYQERVKQVLGPIANSTDSELLHLIAQRVTQKARLIGSLEDSYSPMRECVEGLYKSLETNIQEYRTVLELNPQHVREILRSRKLWVDKYEILHEVVTTLLRQEVRDYYSRHNLRPFFADDSIVSFSTARRVIEERQVQVGIAIGPEGFTYASIFALLGLPILHVHVDEYSTTIDRPYKELDDLRGIAGKYVLLIEDDVQSGKTLERVCENITGYSPSTISLYLGKSRKYQNLANVSKEFAKVYTVPNHLTDRQKRKEIDILIRILERKYRIFKLKDRDKKSINT